SAATASGRPAATSRATSPRSPRRCAPPTRAIPACSRTRSPAPDTESITEAIVLVGPMGAGKTSIGRRVARELGVPFTDTDTLGVRDHGAIATIVTAQG